MDDDYKEWDNPYYGFPQMVRFAFNPNESSRKRLEELKKAGTTYAFSALLKPQSIKKAADGSHKKFVYEREILDLLEVIDGSKSDDELLGFLDYDKLKEGKMCRHIVIVLPYCASCDALEELIKTNKDKFRNLGNYEIVNVSGVDKPNAYRSPKEIKAAIAKCETDGKKTITLTVNRMLTGSTVPEWDTMLYLKDTVSPQEYDQAVFRLQNQYVKTFKDETTGETIKFNMKPQTLLVDFDPNRMFVMQEKKSQIYNANVDTGGNSELEKRISKELEISPIITINKDKIERVIATDILEAVRNYQKDKGIKDEALEIPVDLCILDDSAIRAVIELENEIGSKSGLSIPAQASENEDADSDLDVPETPSDDGGRTTTPTSTTPVSDTDKRKKEISLTKKIQSYYTRILLFAFITKDKVISIADIITKMETEENARIAKNLGLSKQILTLLNQKMNKQVLSKLDYSVQDLNGLSSADNLTPTERANVAVNKFGKLGEAIVITPSNICDDMVKLLPEEFIKSLPTTNGKILDIAGTSGEFAVALHKRMTELGLEKDFIANAIYTISKSSICYELTRKLYEMLELNPENIAKEFVATELLDIKNGNNIDYDKITAFLTQNKPFETIKLTDVPVEGENNMIKFEAVVGNPPYQLEGGSGGSNDAPIYQTFSMLANQIKPNYSSLIMPARWFAAGRENLLGSFRRFMLTNRSLQKLVTYTDSSMLFSTVEIKGGICYYLLNSKYSGDCSYTIIKGNTSQTMDRDLSHFEILIRDPMLSSIVETVMPQTRKGATVDTIISNDTPFGISSNPRSSKKNPLDVFTTSTAEHDVLLYHVENNKRKVEYVRRNDITKNENDIDTYKVFIPGSGGSGDDDIVLGKPEYAPPHSVCSQSFLYAKFATENEARNFILYLKTKFFRALVAAVKISQAAPNKVYQFVPLQDFSVSWTDEKLYSKYSLSASQIQYIETMYRKLD